MKRAFLALAAGLALMLAAAGGLTAAEPAAQVTAIGVAAEGRGFRLELTLDRPARFRAFTLAGPDRLVLDVDAGGWSAATPAHLRAPLVGALRHGLFRPGRFRVVIDLDGPARIARLHMGAGDSGPRVVLEAEPTARETFDAAAGWPEDSHWTRPAVPSGGPGLVVAIDAGHGGIDPGAVEGELLEKDLTLAFSRILAARLREMPGVSVVMTRDDDSFVPLGERVSLARRAGAHVFLSIHADKLAAGDAEGLSLYTLSDEGVDHAADQLAERENRADILAGADLTGAEDDLARVLTELARRATDRESERLATAMLRTFRGEIALLPTRPHRRGNFRVLRAHDMPSILVELGILSNSADRARVLSAEWQQATATLIARAVKAWGQGLDPAFRARN